MTRREIGNIGETFAAQYIERSLGWKVHCRNWRCRWGELDIVAEDRNHLVIVEVRTRRGTRHGSALEAVDGRKTRQIRRLAPLLLWSIHPVNADEIALRFDVVALTMARDQIRDMIHLRDVLDGLA